MTFDVILVHGAASFSSRAAVPDGWHGPDFGHRSDVLKRLVTALPQMELSPWSEMADTDPWIVVFSAGDVSVTLQLREPVGEQLRLCFQGHLSEAIPHILSLYGPDIWGVVDQQTARLNDPADIPRSVNAHLANGRHQSNRKFGSPSLRQRLSAFFRA